MTELSKELAGLKILTPKDAAEMEAGICTLNLKQPFSTSMSRADVQADLRDAAEQDRVPRAGQADAPADAAGHLIRTVFEFPASWSSTQHHARQDCTQNRSNLELETSKIKEDLQQMQGRKLERMEIFSKMLKDRERLEDRGMERETGATFPCPQVMDP